MSTNSDLQQINVFSKGMNTDTSDAYLSTELYRFALNLRFFTDSDANSGELRQIEGWKVKTKYGQDAELLKIATIRDYMIFIEKASNGWSIWATTKDSTGRTLIFGPCTDMIGDNISIVTRYESDKNIKVYIADGKHQLMSVNLIDKDGNYRNYGSAIKDIISDTEIPLMPLTVSVSSALGSVKGPVVQYAYTLYTEGGIETLLSPLSDPLSLYDSSSSGNEDKNTNKSVYISAKWYNSIDYKLYKIKIYRISYVQNGQLPEISLIYDGEINKSFNYTDTGFDILQMSTSEFIALNSIKIKPLLIESKNDYLFAANINYDLQQVDKTFEGCTVTYTPKIINAYKYTLDATTGAVKSGNYTASFRRGETYRFGIVFLTTTGKKSSVMYIDDVKIEKVAGDNGPFEIDSNTGNIIAHPVIVEVNVEMPDKARAVCAGYEIVRCKRTIDDSRCITLGIVGRALKNANVGIDSNVRLASSYMTMDTTFRIATEVRDYNFVTCSDLMMFASPEFVYQPDDVKNVLDFYNNVSLELKYRYSIPFKSATFYGKKEGGNKNGTADASSYTGYIAGNPDPALHDAYTEYAPYGYGFVVYGNSNQNNTNFVVKSTPVYNLDNYTLEAQEEEFSSKDKRRVNFSLLYPTKILGTSKKANFDVDAVGYAETPDPHKFDNGTNVVISDDTFICDTLEFVNWDAVDPYAKTGHFASNNNVIGANDLAKDTKWSWYAVTSGKKCILLKPKTNISGEHEDSQSDWTPAPITVADIVRTNVTPYGGSSDIAKQQSVFYSFGDYYSANAEHQHHVHSGDTYLSIFEYNSAHCWDSPTRRARMYPTVYMVPIESSIDLRATYGDLYSRLDSQYKYYMQDVPCSIRDFSQEKRAYLYNTAYSMTPDILSFTKSEYNSIYSDKYDCRVYYSNLKTNGENTDSWLKFKSANFIDVDTRYGEITQMKLFKDTLVFWQERATGMLSVNERTLIRDANDVNIILGNGDVLQRYDYLTTEYGMKAGDKSDTLSNNALYWWDSNKKDILQYPGGNQVLPLKVNKTVSNYINTITSFAKRPKAEYDSKYQEIMFNISTEGPLVYNEMIQLFTGVYTRPFDHSARFSDYMLLFDGLHAYEWNTKGVNFPILLKYVVNKNSTYTKTFDNMLFGMGELFMFDHFYNGENDKPDTKRVNRNLKFKFKTPLKQTSETTSDITNREYDLRMPIPRDKNSLVYGGRMRGRTMQCEISADTSNNLNFSLQYIITKFRISWS